MEPVVVQRGAQHGAIFGSVLVLLALFGLLTGFADTNLIGLPVPTVMLGVLALWAGFTAFGPPPKTLPGVVVVQTNRAPMLAASAAAGLALGLIAVILAWVATNIDVRSALEKLTPAVT